MGSWHGGAGGDRPNVVPRWAYCPSCGAVTWTTLRFGDPCLRCGTPLADRIPCAACRLTRQREHLVPLTKGAVWIQGVGEVPQGAWVCATHLVLRPRTEELAAVTAYNLPAGIPADVRDLEWGRFVEGYRAWRRR